MSYHHSTASSVSREVSRDSNNNNLLSGDNLLRLALKKPESWKWELTTSSSSPNINFPKIQLFDSVSGELMVEVDQPDCVIRSDCATKPRSQGISTLEQSKAGRPQRYCRSRTSLVKEKLPTSGDSLADIFNQLSNKGLGHKLATSGSQYRLTNGDSDSSRHVLQKSKSASAIAMQEPPIVRRRSRKSVSSRSSSILERISEFYGRSSTDDEDFGDRRLVPHAPSTPTQNNEEAPGEENGVTIEEMPADPPITAPIKARPKIYKLVRSNAGTLMVREESFHTQRSLRRRQRDNLDGAPSEEPPQHERFVEVDDQTEPVVHVPSRYEQEINHIDHLLSRVMLSHDLQTEELPRHDVPNIRISSVEDDVAGTGSTHGPINHLQNGRVRRTRRHRRSVSVGSGVTSSRHRSISSGRSNSPADRTDRRRRSSSSSSEAECASRLNDPPAGYSSRSNSLKRRGRTRRRGDTRDSSTPKSNECPSWYQVILDSNDSLA
ncbi:AGAP000294-PA-like protein [Anopheles sinensis]|uniref:AGAP000294-PA-like protein n=1 Tax=Anopheles sinensis TaxID=74873 RepID=A0A084WPN6_ANOSI|nr:AGAP000294-PA-like protein [Anopheles sinensis]